MVRKRKKTTAADYFASVDELEAQAKELRQKINEAKQKAKVAQEAEQIEFERSLAQPLIEEYQVNPANRDQFLQHIQELLNQRPFKDNSVQEANDDDESAE